MNLKTLIFASAMALTQPGFSKTPQPLDTLKACVASSVEGIRGNPDTVVDATLENIRTGKKAPPEGLKKVETQNIQSCINEYEKEHKEKVAIEQAKKEYREKYVHGSVGMIQKDGGQLRFSDGTLITTVISPKEFEFAGLLIGDINRVRKAGTIDRYSVTEWGSELFRDGKGFYRIKESYDESEVKDTFGRVKQTRQGKKASLERINIEGVGANTNLRFAETGLGLIVHPTGFFLSKPDGNLSKIQLPIATKINTTRICDNSGEWSCRFIVIGGKKYALDDVSGRLIEEKEAYDFGNLGVDSAIPFEKAYNQYILRDRRDLAKREWSVQARMINEALSDVRNK